MTMTSDELVRDYLERLGRAAAGLPAADREELLEQITGHIASARADSVAAGEGDGPAVTRGVLDRLGPPGEVAAAAGAEPPAADGADRRNEIAAAVLCGIGWIFIVGWVIGLILVIRSRRWSAWQKTAVALLPVPAWALLTIAHVSSATVSSHGLAARVTSMAGTPRALAALFVLLAVVTPLVLGAWLVRRTRRPSN